MENLGTSKAPTSNTAVRLVVVGKCLRQSQLLKAQTQVMEAILNLVEGESSKTDVESIDLDKLRQFQTKCSVWDFYDMTKEEYKNKLPSEKQDLILSYYNKMVQGMLFVICCLESVMFQFLCLESLEAGLC